MSNSIKYSVGNTWFSKQRQEIKDAYYRLTDKVLKIRANEDAQDGLVEGYNEIPSGSTTEIEIVNALRENEANLISHYTSGLSDLKMKLQSSIPPKIAPITENSIQEKMNVEYNKVSRNSLMGKDAEKFAEAKYRLRNFIHRHERDTPAKFPDTLLKPIALLLFFFLAETIINGTVFKDLSGGFIGGILQAAFFALINILLAYVEGTAWRFLIYTDIRKESKTFLFKVIGYVLTPLFLFLGFAWNLGIAHFREVATSIEFSDMPSMAQKSFDNLIQHPFALHQMEAYALFIFGMIVFFIVAKDFYSGFYDPFFDYGKVTKEKITTEDNWEEAKSEMEEELEFALREMVDGIESDEGDIDGYALLKKRNEDTVRAARESFKNFLNFRGDIQDDLEIILKEGRKKIEYYREQYTNIVGVNGRKEHFSVELNLLYEVNTDIWNIDTIENLVKEIENTCEKNEKIYTEAIYLVEKNIPFFIDKLYANTNYGDEFDGYFKELLDAKETEVAQNHKRNDNEKE